ncbi:MAG: DUF4339 domain-containing protein [Bythopirellula sp.]|nr:DUF4339 domain-containing protein [Bythopirellula sp.]
MSNWFVTRNGKELGPFNYAQLRQFAVAKKLSPADLIRREDMQKPMVASKIQGLFAASQPPISQVAATATAMSIPPQPQENVAEPADPRKFSTWYKSRLGKLPIIVQVMCWVLYGLVWIPAWWLISLGGISRVVAIIVLLIGIGPMVPRAVFMLL